MCRNVQLLTNSSGNMKFFLNLESLATMVAPSAHHIHTQC